MGGEGEGCEVEVRGCEVKEMVGTPSIPTSTNSKYRTTCLVSTLVSTISWLVHTPHSVPSSYTVHQPVLIVSTEQLA